jgi:hypothetical protein
MYVCTDELIDENMDGENELTVIVLKRGDSLQ